MSRFEREWAVVPDGARWTAVLVCLAVTALMAGLFLVPGFVERDGTAVAMLVPLFFVSLFGVAFLGAYVLLVGYVWGDAKRRGMNQVLWTLLAIFIPNAIGIILYFILRDPVAVPCPSCGTPARKGHAYCASCGAAVRAACPQCRQPVEPGWHNCARCGAPLAAPVAPGMAAAP
jgi:Double zinc ribbon